MQFRSLTVLALIAFSASAGAQRPDGSPVARSTARANARPDTNVFLVLPFSVSAPADLQYLGEGIVDILHMTLDRVGSMRIENAPATRRQLTLEMASEIPAPSASAIRSAASLARDIGAGRVMKGSIIALGSNVRIQAEVFDAVTNKPLFTAESRADVKNVDAAVDSLAARILARRMVPASERKRLATGEFETKSAGALQAFLIARQHWLRAERRIAADSLKSALHQDTTFGRAYLLLHRIAGAGGALGLPSTVAILKAALEHEAHYPERVRAELQLVVTQLQQQRVQAMALGQEMARRYPDDPDIAFRLADLYFHFGLNLGEPVDRAAAAFRRAFAFDDQDPELLNHAPSVFELAGDTVEARAIESRCQRLRLCNPGGPVDRVYRGDDPQRTLIGPDSAFAGPNAFFALTSDRDPGRVLAAYDTLGVIQGSPTHDRRLRATWYMVRAEVALARGQYERSWAFLDSAKALDLEIPARRYLNHLVAGIHGASLPTRFDPSNTLLMLTVGWWASVRASPDSAETILRQLENRQWPDSAIGAATATALRGILALRGGDTSRAIQLLTQARANHKRFTANRTATPGAWLAMKLAELEAARGNYAAARLNMLDMEPANFYVPFLGDAEELRARIALATGDTLTAKTSLKKMIAVWENADAVLQPRVAAARATLARLDNK